jgi:hypothetical protein
MKRFNINYNTHAKYQHLSDTLPIEDEYKDGGALSTKPLGPRKKTG